MANETVIREKTDSGFRVRYIFYFALVLLAFLAIVSYSPADAASVTGGVDSPPANWIGNLGAHLGYWLFNLFGLATYVLLVLTLLRTVRALLPGRGRPWMFLMGEALLLLGVMLLFALSPNPFAYLTDKLGIGRIGMPELALSGGAIGQVLAAPAVEDLSLQEGLLRNLIGAVGTTIFGWALLTGGLVIVYFSDWHSLFRDYVFSGAIRPEADAAPLTAQTVEPDGRRSPAPVPGGLFGSARAALEVLRAKHMHQPQPAASSAAPVSAAPPAVEEPELVPIPEAPDIPAAPSPAPAPPPAPPVVASPPVIPEPAPAPAASTPAPPVIAPPPPPVIPEPAPAPAPRPMPAASTPAPPVIAPPPPARTPTMNVQVAEHGQKASAVHTAEYVLPPISMLSKGNDSNEQDTSEIERLQLILQRTLDSFKVPGVVTDYIAGPRIIRFEISLDEGVNVKKVEQIADNIAMNLSAKSVRVLAPIPGRNVVGIEVPKSRSEAVFMRSLMETDAWRNTKSGIPIVLGKDVAGTPVILDLAKAPHLLIAGATGSGKSVCMNTLISSLLFRFGPDELRLIMVDPKIVEFEDYKRLPHLITPVINDSRKVPIALRWAVTEMENRYKILARAGVKKLAEYNSRPPSPEPILDPEGKPIPDKMPILIVIIDELAELMMTDARKDSETYIARIAQLGRAAGVHIVVATQRPSTQIVTGVIKANLPTRIAFRVGQMIDSRVILDQNGAEKLLGMGDMLFLAPGGMELERVQGALVADSDIKQVVKFVSDQREQSFNSQVVAEEEEVDGEDDPNLTDYDDQDYSDIAPLIRKYVRPGDDDNIKKALEVVVLDRKVSTSYLQRRLKIGYNRAAEIIDILEDRGIVGPPSGSGNKREILIFDGMEINE